MNYDKENEHRMCIKREKKFNERLKHSTIYIYNAKQRKKNTHEVYIYTDERTIRRSAKFGQSDKQNIMQSINIEPIIGINFQCVQSANINNFIL